MITDMCEMKVKNTLYSVTWMATFVKWWETGCSVAEKVKKQKKNSSNMGNMV